MGRVNILCFIHYFIQILKKIYHMRYFFKEKVYLNIENRKKNKIEKKIKMLIKRKKERKIFDCFTFFNEIELLHLRFLEYYSVVDYFVICEAKTSFTGKKHELVFEKNKERFAQYLDKVIYIVIDELPQNTKDNIWIAEYYQRNFMYNKLSRYAKFGDIILLSDVDEFWNKDCLSIIKKSITPLIFQQDLFYFYVNMKKENIKWNGTCYAPFGYFSQGQSLRDFSRNTSIKKEKESFLLKNGGWHYTYGGGGTKNSSKNA